MTTAAKTPFPRTFYIANAIELLERLAFYGLYIGLSLYLVNVVGMSDKEVGSTLGNWRFFASLAPIPCGAIADRLSFKRSLVLAFTLYAIGYGTIFLVPQRAPVILGLFLTAFAGGFLKPVITGTVVRTSPEGRQAEGFAIFYRMVNSGSVVGKTLAFLVRRLVAIRFVSFTSVVASLGALALAAFAYEEPPASQDAKKGPALSEVLRGYRDALRNLRFAGFLVVAAGFYFMIEQFYMTFPTYVTRHIDKNAPLELITLINPAFIALFQGFVLRALKNVKAVTAMVVGVLVASTSMLVMGAVPSLVGACLSGALFACAEMCFSPRFYEFVASFAPKGKEGMYMGLVFVPAAIGSWFGGQVSGRLIAAYLPKEGARDPLAIWSTYAGLGLVCALGIFAYGALARPKPAAEA